MSGYRRFQSKYSIFLQLRVQNLCEGVEPTEPQKAAQGIASVPGCYNHGPGAESALPCARRSRVGGWVSGPITATAPFNPEDPGLVQLTGPSEAWGRLVLAACGGRRGKPPPFRPSLRPSAEISWALPNAP